MEELEKVYIEVEVGVLKPRIVISLPLLATAHRESLNPLALVLAQTNYRTKNEQFVVMLMKTGLSK